ncbi:MAG TPA: hypothetical protein VF043_25310 [Ktedonobacteraceae bacterium]
MLIDNQDNLAPDPVQDPVVANTGGIVTGTTKPGNGEEESNESDWESEAFSEDFQEEEVPSESEEQFGIKYRVDNQGNSGSAVAAIGDNPQITINNYIHIIKEARQRASNEDDSDGEDSSNDRYELIRRVLTLERQSGTFPVNTVTTSETIDTQMPVDEEKISDWYYKLDQYEQCYVQAVAILHGISATEVSRRADNLYMSIETQKERLNNTLPQAAQQTEARTGGMYIPSSHTKPSRLLQAKTHTFTQRIYGVERLFWIDVDIYGLSKFELRLLDFLAGEFMSKGVHGQGFLEVLRQWSQESEKEHSWRSARALGVFLWRQNVDELLHMANEWARKRSLRGWRRTAMLLEGAYEIDCLKHPEKEGDIKSSPVFQLLNGWVERGKQNPSLTDIYMKCAAANAYELIGKEKPTVAIQGLEQLVSFTLSESAQDTNRLFAAVVSAYVSLSWSGHIHDVLTHLALISKEAILQCLSPIKLSERNLYRQQCEAQLDVALKAFFLISADSCSQSTTNNFSAYNKPLPDLPSFPDSLGRDIILAGLLAQGTKGWSEQVTSLLCAAIMERSRENRPAAFDLIYKWAETLLKMQDGSDSCEKQLIKMFSQFMATLSKTLNAWHFDLKRRGKHSPPANTIYRRRLEQWSRGKHTIGPLVQEVLCQLNG